MAHKPKACTLAPKHTWEFVRNVTLKNVTMSARGTMVKISYRGKYRCACGELRLGISRPEVSSHD
ncbi:hypothetical protein P3W85_29700 [Cupriavidus basilensis]|uniref:Uncharacterized protein n=1 Tax=Cupriavidus basilensis TaxID=68895 RepID=A0ABT6AWW8_9BURK|nr:hypothetical protein [Cupriavidus basilensis]MDF3837097.1 hypothetical protein [Cupriavidus basilensis]